MIVTKEQQEALIENYIKDKHNLDECTGFISGVYKTMELIDKINKHTND